MANLAEFGSIFTHIFYLLPLVYVAKYARVLPFFLIVLVIVIIGSMLYHLCRLNTEEGCLGGIAVSIANDQWFSQSIPPVLGVITLGIPNLIISVLCQIILFACAGIYAYLQGDYWFSMATGLCFAIIGLIIWRKYVFWGIMVCALISAGLAFLFFFLDDGTNEIYHATWHAFSGIGVYMYIAAILRIAFYTVGELSSDNEKIANVDGYKACGFEGFFKNRAIWGPWVF